jgi:outer membrane autotransporter protein
MNNIHCSVWNAALGAWVAVSELSRRRRTRRACISSAAAAAVCLLALASLPGTASAQAAGGSAVMSNGGTGGRGGVGNGGGAGGGSVGEFPTSNGQPPVAGVGGAGGNGAGGAGGTGGAVGATSVTGSASGSPGTDGVPDGDPVYGAGGGGGGGAAVYSIDTAITAAAGITLQGGNGGNGGAARLSGGGGGGGAGLQAVAAGATLNIAGQLTGGQGGAGSVGQWAGGGGGGGDGMVLQGGGASVIHSGIATGGRGGDGGASTSGTRLAGGGGEGGAGLALESSGNAVINSGVLQGGAGGAGGSSTVHGIGGAGLRIRGDANTIVNTGALNGGLGGDGATLGDAVRITGNDNALELQSGSVVNGSLVANGDGNLLRLAGTLAGGGTSLDAASYRGFARYEKTGTSTWTLSGTTTELTPWHVLGGTLAMADDGALGNPAGVLTLDGATLRATGTTTGTRNVTLGAGGGAFEVDAGHTLALDGMLSGAGSLRKTGAGTLVLGAANGYGGGTAVEVGSLEAAATGALGGGPVSVAADASLLFSGTADASGLAITAAGRGGAVRFGDAASAGTARLVMNNDASLEFRDSASAGAAVIENRGGLIDFSGNATADQATVVNEAGARVRIDSLGSDGIRIGSLGGAGAVILGGKALTTGGLDTSTEISGVISGTGGSLVKAGTGTLTLSGANTYTGATSVAQGTLRAGAANTFSAASAHGVAAGATLDLAGLGQRVAALANGGTVSLVGSAPGTTLTVSGPYTGNNGVLRLGTALGADGSASDRLVLDGPGAVASGSTTVQIVNLGGLGALTSGNGIEVISARNGATTTAQTTKSAFSLAGGHVDAGAYEYRLHAADAGGAGENWYLRATTDAVAPVDPVAPPVVVPTYRAEASLYAALPGQLRQGSLAMLGDLRKRVGDDDVKGTAAAPAGSPRRAWARVLSADIDIQQGGTVAPTGKGRLTGVQAGTDLLAAPRWRAGLYVGQLEGDVRVSGFASGLQNLGVGRNDLRSQYVGIYGTYTGDGGLYADAVVQAGRHRYTVQPGLGGGVEGKGHSLLGSIEVGQAFALGSSGWRVEPQLQLIHQHLDLDNAAIVGAVVQPGADSGWIARAGIRLKGEVGTGAGTLQPYGRFNVYKRSGGADVARFVNGATRTDIAAPSGGTSTELAGGFTLALGHTTSLYGEVGKLWSSGGDAKVKSSVNASLGVRVKW